VWYGETFAIGYATNNQIDKARATFSRYRAILPDFGAGNLLRTFEVRKAAGVLTQIVYNAESAIPIGFADTRSTQSEEGAKMVSLADARRVIAAAEKKAAEIGQPMNIAVADEGGNIVAHVRMDGAWIGSIDISQKKAYTSRAFDIATKDLAAHSQSGGQFFGIHASNNGKIMIFAGGIPLKRDGKVVGAIGVSGGSGDQDHAVAEAGAKAF
jgi:uncharacterized protein GlcG (DUF336 family)